MALESQNKTAAIERALRRVLVAAAIVGLMTGILARVTGYPTLAGFCWTFATVPVVAGLAAAIVRDLSGEAGGRAIATARAGITAANKLVTMPITNAPPRSTGSMCRPSERWATP